MDKGTKHALLTTTKLEGLKRGEWASDPAPRGEGRLLARRLATGRVMLYYRYTTDRGKRDTLSIGMFDARGRDGLTLAGARTELGKLRRERERDGDIRVTRDEAERAARAQEATEQVAHEAALAKRARTLGALLAAYTDQMERDGKSSTREVRRALELHVRDAWPKLWAAPLMDLTTDDLLAIVAAVADEEHLRQAEKIRAYLRAAFAAGMKARHNAKALPVLRALCVTANPARDLTPIEGANRARDRALSLAELRAYWKRIQGPELAALRFHLLTGGQRVTQLARATKADIDADAQSLRLLDYKGRRRQPRQHHVPLLPEAMVAMDEMRGGAVGPFVFTLTAGKSGADYAGIFRRVCATANAMTGADELTGDTFTPGDLRRTVETILSSAQVSKETRGHLQSHGLNGVQDRHYDKHDYAGEKRAAMKILVDLLATDVKVAPIRKRV